MRLGLYQNALNVLSRKYPAVVPDQSEPGTIGPNEHPLVAYFRGYCRQKLGQPATADYAAASKLSTAYVFPSTAEEFTVLKAAVQTNPNDGTAHYLLGTFYFSRGLTDPALTEWASARKFAPQTPVLSASTGLALLHVKNDPAGALAAFRDGMSSDPDNIANYVGTDQALSLLKHPSSERAAALSKFPKLDSAPPDLIYELILNLSEAGEFDRAEKLFHNRFFAREEGGTNVRQVWIEVQLQRAMALVERRKCSEAVSTVKDIGAEVPDLAFTHDGLEPILNSARTSYMLGAVYESCKQPEDANKYFNVATTASSPDQLRWAWLAAQKLSNFNKTDWQSRLHSALEQAQARTETSGYPSWWFYNAGMLQRDLGQKPEQSFQKALLLPDRMLSYHFTRLAMSEAKP